VAEPGVRALEDPCWGLLASRSTARLLTYYLLFVAVALLLFLALLRIVNSPFGRVLQAIRENDFRAEAIGYRTVVYRTLEQRAVGAVRHRSPARCWRCGCATSARTPR
jgi:branched-chain amino acid transport system permease protein